MNTEQPNIQSLSQKCSEYLQTIEQNNNEKKQLQELYDALLLEYQTVFSEKNDLNEKINSINLEHEKLSTQLDESSKKCDEYLENIEQKNEDYVQLKKLYDDLLINYQTVFSEKNILEEKITLINSNYEELIERINSSTEKWEESKQSFLTEKQMLQDFIDKLNEEFLVTKNALQESDEKCLNLEFKIKNLEEQNKLKYESLLDQLNESNLLKENLQTKVTQLMEKNTKISREFAEAEKFWFEKQ